MSLISNGIEVKKSFCNGVDLSRIFVNTELVFQKGLILALPQSTTEINIAAFIAANNPGNYDNITITNSLVQPRIVTGDLSGLEVVFINNPGAKIQGTNLNSDAFQATSAITLHNNGAIMGAGGRGGKGGKGANSTYTKNHSQSQQAQWKVRIPEVLIEVYDGGVLQARTGNNQNFTGPINGSNGKRYTRGALIKAYPEDKAYGWNATWSTTQSRTGGAGGAGGKGTTFESSFAAGSPGLPSSPTGGNSGGAGGSGSIWGTNGANGAKGAGAGSDGSAGEAAGNAIVGTEFLNLASTMGTLFGASVETR